MLVDDEVAAFVLAIDNSERKDGVFEREREEEEGMN
jgi:hypothetical protein